MISEIFVVDDDCDMRDTLTAVFGDAGYGVREFADGRTFLRIARSEVPTCVLFDICMPESSGLKVLRELDAKSYPAPVIILSGRAARGVEEVLRGPYEKQRGLTADEVLLLKRQLHMLREAAPRELQFFYAH